MGLRDLLNWTKAKLFGPSKKTLEAAEAARQKIEDACTQTADLTFLRDSLRKEKTQLRRKASDAVSGVRGRTEEETEKMREEQKPLSREEAEAKLGEFGWRERK